MKKTNDEKRYCVYMHTFPNGKRYIGQTCQKPERRWNNNGNGYLGKRKNGEYKQPLIANAIQKYGWENVQHEILFDNLTHKEANRIEQICMILFRTKDRRFGYNINEGGEHGEDFHISDDTKQKISNTLKEFYSDPKNRPMLGRKMSEESKKRMSDAQKKRFQNSDNHPMKGKHLSDEAKQKISDAQKGKRTGEENHFYGKFHSNETKKQISQTKKANYIKENHPNYRKHLSEETKEKIRQAHLNKRILEADKTEKTSAVHCIELNITFLTMKEASYNTPASYCCIGTCCKNNDKTTGGYHWRYATQDEIIAEKKRRGMEVV